MHLIWHETVFFPILNKIIISFGFDKKKKKEMFSYFDFLGVEGTRSVY